MPCERFGRSFHSCALTLPPERLYIRAAFCYPRTVKHDVTPARPRLERTAMQAVITTGGKQYLVKTGQVLDVELLGDAKKAEFDALMTIDGDKVTVGQPVVKGVKVAAEVVEEVKGEKLQILRFKAK